jgi:CheY-like chemotaxis protein
MEDEGMEVVEASDADKALEVLEHRSGVKLLFTDINMPGSMDGLDLAREVHERWPQVLLMLTSGRRPPLTHIPRMGEFIPKPYDFEERADRSQSMLKR